MEDRSSVRTDSSGRRVTAKVAGTIDQAQRLENEAALLEAGRHPGVVELVGIDGHGVGAVLSTAEVEGLALGQIGPLPLEEAAGLLASLATTLADLHDLGLVHGALCPDHVVVGPAGRPVLCSFGYGGRAGERCRSVPSMPPEFLDPAHVDMSALTPSIDVFGLGALARYLAPSAPAGHALAAVAEEATSDDPSARPPARAVAAALQRAVPTARLPRGLAPQVPRAAAPPPPRADPLAAWRQERGGGGGRRGRWGQVADRPGAKGVAAVLVATAVGAALLMVLARPGPAPRLTTGLSPDADAPVSPGIARQEPPGQVRPGPSTTRAGLTSAPVGPTTSTTGAVALRRDCATVTAVLQADADGDGCPEAMRYTAGILEAGARRWSLGAAGDQVATGDWGCQGARTLALFRPSTGEIFRFADWASLGRDVHAPVVARVDGGQVLRAADLDRDGCHEAVVERGPGLPVEVIRLPPGKR